jgi:hypothetical protein
MSKFGVDTTTDYNQILSDYNLFFVYTDALAEEVQIEIKDEFKEISQLVREGLLVETVYGFSPQAPMVMPVVRKLWPQSKLAA